MSHISRNQNRKRKNLFDDQTFDQKCQTVINTEAERWVDVRLVKINEITNEVCKYIIIIIDVYKHAFLIHAF